MHFSCVVIAALFIGAIAAVPTAKPLIDQAPLTVDATNQRLKDEYGRELYFHGSNVIMKGAPWIPDRTAFSWNLSFVAKDMQIMKGLGFNAIRLGTMWPGIEPVRGQYNMTYLHQLREMVEEASTYGIRSLLDMHQDVLSEKFCGEGLPNWATITNVTNFPWPLQATPFNTTPDGVPQPYMQCAAHNWASYYPTKAVGEAFQNLYDNGFGLRDSWAAVWQMVAKVMKSTGAAVLGYELFNEPWAGDVWKNPLLMVPGVADALNLAPAYEVLQAAIRRIDDTHPIFFEGVTWDWFNVGFTEVPGGAAYRNKSVLSYHFYTPPDFSLDVQFAARQKDMSRLGCGGFLTEFGSKSGHGCGNVQRDSIMDKCDADLQSWAFWEYKIFDPITGVCAPVFYEDGTLNQTFARKFARTYAQIVAGTTQLMKYNVSTEDFDLIYTPDASVTLPETIIFASTKYHYASGYTVQLTPNNTAQVWYNISGDYVHVYHAASVVGTDVAVRIRAL